MSETKSPPDIAEEALRALRNTQPMPDSGRMELERQAFLAQARRLRQQQPVSYGQVVRHRKWIPQPLSKGWANMSGLVRALLVLALLSGSAAGTAAAADASLPGQPLYAVDALMERTRLQLAGTPEQQAQIALRLSEERALELNRLAENNSPLVAAQADRLQTQLQQTLRLAAQLDDPQMVQLLTRLQLMTQTQEQLMTQAHLQDGAAIMAQVQTQAQIGLTDPGAFRAMVQTRQMFQGGQEDEPTVDEGDDEALPTEEPTDEITDLPGQNGNNTDPGDPDPGNDTPGIGQQGNMSPGGNEAAGTPGPRGNNDDPGDPAPGNDDSGSGQQGGNGNGGGEQGNGNK